MDRSEASALADLQMHWDEAYVITLDGHIWCARYRTSAEQLRAHTSLELRELIRSDYAYRQKADLVAYDPDGDYDDGEDGEVAVGADGARGEDAAADGAQGEDAAAGGGTAGDRGSAGDDETGANGAVKSPAQAGGEVSPDVDAGDFAAIRGERMSI